MENHLFSQLQEATRQMNHAEKKAFELIDELYNMKHKIEDDLDELQEELKRSEQSIEAAYKMLKDKNIV